MHPKKKLCLLGAFRRQFFLEILTNVRPDAQNWGILGFQDFFPCPVLFSLFFLLQAKYWSFLLRRLEYYLGKYYLGGCHLGVIWAFEDGLH